MTGVCISGCGKVSNLVFEYHIQNTRQIALVTVMSIFDNHGPQRVIYVGPYKLAGHRLKSSFSVQELVSQTCISVFILTEHEVNGNIPSLTGIDGGATSHNIFKQVIFSLL